MTTIQLATDYPTHVKTAKLVKRLGAIAELFPIRLWLWAAENAKDGQLGSMEADELAAICGFRGCSGSLFSALLDAGFLEQTEAGYRIRSWTEHNQPKRRTNRKEHAEVRLPDALNREPFLSAWSDWLIYKADRKEFYVAPGMRSLLTQLADRGPEEAAAALHLSMAHGAKGPASRRWLLETGWAPAVRPPDVVTQQAKTIDSKSWVRILTRITEEMKGRERELGTWIYPLQPVREGLGTLTLAAPNRRFAATVEDDYRQLIDSCAPGVRVDIVSMEG